MAAKRIILFFFTVLTAINFLTAQEGSGDFEFEFQDDSSKGNDEHNEHRQAGFPFGMSGLGGSQGGFFPGLGGQFGNLFGSQNGNPFAGQPANPFGGQSEGLFDNQPGNLFGGGLFGGQNGNPFRSQSEGSFDDQNGPFPGGPPLGSDGRSDRFFFSFPTITSCNYTTQAGRTCISCTQSLRCRSNNVGYVKRCHGLFPYCNNGRCSFFQGALCTASTAGAATTTAADTTTATPTTTISGTT